MKKASTDPDVAVSYASEEPRRPPARSIHNTFPNAAVIVHEPSTPGDDLHVTSEERQRLELLFADHRRRIEQQERSAKLEAGDRNAETVLLARAIDTVPTRKHTNLLMAIVAIAVACVVGVIVLVALGVHWR